MLSVSESAAILGVSEQRVRAMIASGVLPAEKIGKAWALRKEDVLDRASSKPTGGRPRRDVQMPEQPAPAGAAPREELKRLYHECKDAFRFRPGAADIQAAESGEEAAFYLAVADFFLKERQAELVKAGVY